MADVVNFQSFNRYNADVMGCTTFSFALNLGIYLTDVPSDYPLPFRASRVCPEEYHCQIRRRLEPPRPALPNAADIWVIDESGKNLEDTVQAAALELLDVAMPWFANFSDTSAVLAMLRDRLLPPDALTWLPGTLDSPVRNTVTGYVARALGEDVLAANHLRRALDQLRTFDTQHEPMRLGMPKMVPRHLEETVAELDRQSAS